MNTEIREITINDAPAAGRLIFEAFRSIADENNFPRDFPSAESGVEFAQMWTSHSSIYGVVAEENGKIVGSNFLTERNSIRGVGPITVDPSFQSGGIGRRLMEAVIERGKEAAGIRLVQDAFNAKSMSLYASLGFDVREPLALLNGRPAGEVSDGVIVRPMKIEDLSECGELAKQVHGFHRKCELSDALQSFNPYVAVRGGRIPAYASTVTFWQLNHGVAETETDLRDLFIGASSLLNQPVSILLPVRQAELHRWALKSGLRMVKPMTLMSMGEYHEPRGPYFPSVEY